MCYSNSSTSSTQQLAERYHKLVPAKPVEWRYFFASGFQFPIWNIITNDTVIKEMRWGLLPHWYGGGDWYNFASKTLNARIETCFEKASFKHLVQSNRCLVPSTGFFEWQTREKIKIPYFVNLRDQPIFSIAGLYDQWLNPSTGERSTSFTILTTKANALMEEIHNIKHRMPLILQAHEEKDWLYGTPNWSELSDRSDLQLEAWPVSKKIISGPNANSPSVILKHEYNFGEQKGLFD